MFAEVEQSRSALLTFEHVADRLGVSQRTVWHLVKRGQLVAVKIGRSVRFDPADLDRFVAESKK